jgi:hypothetical protein
METFKLSYYIDNYKLYNQIYPWLDDKQIKKIFKIKKDKKKYYINGIIFNQIYLLTPYIYEYGINYMINGLECELLFKSFEFKFNLFLIKGDIKQNGINIYDIIKIIPDKNEKLQYDNKLYEFKIIHKNIPNKQYLNIYYIVNNINVGVPVYQNNNFIGMSISNTEIINVFNIYNTIKEWIEYKTFSGFYTLYYNYVIIDNKLTQINDNYNISYNKESTINRNNIKKNDILLEIDGYTIFNNNIEHNIFGLINIYTYVLLNYIKNEVIKMKIQRDNKIKNININTRTIYSIEIINTNNNIKTEYCNKDQQIYFELNYLMITNLINLGYNVPKSIKYLIINDNINIDDHFEYRIIMKYNEKEKDIKFENILENIGNKNIKNIKDII